MHGFDNLISVLIYVWFDNLIFLCYYCVLLMSGVKTFMCYFCVLLMSGVKTFMCYFMHSSAPVNIKLNFITQKSC
jgi:hypothetical protein